VGQGRAGGGGLVRQVLPAEKRIPGVRLKGVFGGGGCTVGGEAGPGVGVGVGWVGVW